MGNGTRDVAAGPQPHVQRFILKTKPKGKYGIRVRYDDASGGFKDVCYMTHYLSVHLDCFIIK